MIQSEFPHSSRLRAVVAPLALLLAASPCLPAAPLRVLLSGENNAFTGPYAAALKAGGAQVASGEPDEAKLANSDVVLLQRDKYELLSAASQAALTAFANRGGGIVSVGGAIAAGPEAWGKEILGGAWNAEDSRKFSSLMMLYVVSDAHAITRDSSPFDITDDTVYDLDLTDKVTVMGSAFTPHGKDPKRGEGPRVPGKDVRATIYDLQPQMWTHEGSKHRAAVFLQNAPATFAHASFRSFVMRAVAWTGKRGNTDEFCTKADIASLRYPAGGPQRAADAIKSFKLQPGFVASVVASEPMLNKPIAIQWDGKGRMWVAETPEYPNGKRPLRAPSWKETGVLEPGNYDRPGRDSISMLEDTDGDGLMDKKHVFHTGLELVTGFCLSGDGVIAVAQPSIVWLRDTDGDGTVDTQTPLFNGFNPGDTHFVANHFIEAPDGWIYASTGSGADATNPTTGKLMAKVSPGVFRFRPDGSAIEQVASQGGNSFGGEVTSDMEIYHGKATSGDPIQHVAMPEWVLERAQGTKASSFFSSTPGLKVGRKDLSDRAPIMQIDQVGRYTAACATAVYEGGAWPKEYNGKMFMSEPILDVIHCEDIQQDGPVMKGVSPVAEDEWLRSSDYWFCPIDVSFGPDGAMYIVDFNTPVVTHNDTRGPQHAESNSSVRPDRDHYFGRIYRIQHQNATKFPIPDLYHANAAGLVAAFKHPNKTVRFNAIRILIEKADELGKQAVPALTTMATGESFAPARILALWALNRLNQLKEPTLDAAMTAQDAAVRKNAFLIAESAGISLGGKQATAGIGDKDARVRLAALRALGASTMTPEASAVLLASNAKLDDEWSKAAAAAATSKAPNSPLEQVLADAGGSGQTEESVRSMAAGLASGPNQSQISGVLAAAAASPNAALVAAVLSELGKAPPAPPRSLGGALSSLRTLLASSNRKIAASALPLAAAWDKGGVLEKEVTKTAGELLNVARDPKMPDTSRAEAIRILLPARAVNKFILPNVIALLTKPQSDAVSKDLIVSLAATGEADAGRALADAYPTLPEVQQETAFNALVGRAEWTKLLLDSWEAKKIDAKALPPARVSRLTAHPDAATAKRSQAIFGNAAAGKDKLVASLMPEAEKPGNVANGKTMFNAMCSTCHMIEGAGHVFGPNLDGIGSHPVQELLTHIVNPSLVVDDEHRTWNITMKDGTQHSALIASENEARVQLRMPAGVTLDLKPGDIATREKGANSLMPDGLEAIGTDNLRDIISYIRSVAPKTK